MHDCFDVMSAYLLLEVGRFHPDIHHGLANLTLRVPIIVFIQIPNWTLCMSMIRTHGHVQVSFVYFVLHIHARVHGACGVLPTVYSF